MNNEIQATDLVKYDGLALRCQRKLNIEEFQYVLDLLWDTYERSQFYLGDLLNNAEMVLGESYAQLIDCEKYRPKTLANFKYVASNIRPAGRWKELSFSHHAECAKLEPNLQDSWLKQAHEQQMSVSELRKAIKGEPAEKKKKVINVRCPSCGHSFDWEEK